MTNWQHALLKMMEEAAEVQQLCSKCMQFGMDEKQPGQDLTNRQRLESEIRDFQAAHFRLVDLGLVGDNDQEPLKEHILRKDNQVDIYYSYSRKLGMVE